jgi:hypothetical protein
VGSNVGGEMYKAFLKPLVGRTGVGGELRNFWLVFSLLGVATMFGLMLYNKLFGKDTPVTRMRARKVMYLIYGLLIVCSIAVLYLVSDITPKTWIQAGILFMVGLGGLYTMLKSRGGLNQGRSEIE